MVLKASLTHFSVVLPHVRSEFTRLKELGHYEQIDTIGPGRFKWTFPLKYRREVEIALNGRVIHFDDEQLKREVLPHCKPLLLELELTTQKQGKGTISVVKDEDGYRVSWVEKGKEQVFIVAKSLVELEWRQVYCKLNVGEHTQSSKVWKKIVRALEKYHWDDPLMADDKQGEEVKEDVKVGRWNSKAGHFSSKRFYGDRRYYRTLYYAPVKVLQALGLIDMDAKGITRIGHPDEFDNQARFIELKMIEEARLQETPEVPGQRTTLEVKLDETEARTEAT